MFKYNLFLTKINLTKNFDKEKFLNKNICLTVIPADLKQSGHFENLATVLTVNLKSVIVNRNILVVTASSTKNTITDKATTKLATFPTSATIYRKWTTLLAQARQINDVDTKNSAIRVNPSWYFFYTSIYLTLSI